jgi:DNA segregation ATPase FtsK/SpoIIIE, S-DNA-T family
MQDKRTTLTNILKASKIKAICASYSDLPGCEIYDLKLAPGGKITDLRRYMNEIQLALKTSVAFLSISTEKGLLRLEVAKKNRPMIHLEDINAQNPIPTDDLNCLLGRTLTGDPLWVNLATAPHIMIGGTTGSGKSTLIHTLIENLLIKRTHLLLLDPKGCEFSRYEQHSNVNVAYDYDTAIDIVHMLVDEMDKRYRIGNLPHPPMTLIIDEFADIVSQDWSKSFYDGLKLLAQKSRAANIHIILATQRPSVGVLDGDIKANLPVRIACRVASGIDSRILLDEQGAEKLMGAGDAILKDSGRSLRFQVASTQ